MLRAVQTNKLSYSIRAVHLFSAILTLRAVQTNKLSYSIRAVHLFSAVQIEFRKTVCDPRGSLGSDVSRTGKQSRP
jgi:hypothetical protein